MLFTFFCFHLLVWCRGAKLSNAPLLFFGVDKDHEAARHAHQTIHKRGMLQSAAILVFILLRIILHVLMPSAAMIDD
jgi:hypothetical protein